jgi:low temperature requirement protein LtrA
MKIPFFAGRNLSSPDVQGADFVELFLLATGVAFVMASSVGEAFGDGVMWFAVPYIIIRTIGIALYARVTTGIGAPQRIRAFAIPSFVGLIAIMAGALADPGYRIWRITDCSCTCSWLQA